MSLTKTITYSEAILEAFNWLLKNDDRVFAIGQGLWSPWYVGNTMKGLEVAYGKERIIDTPVSELAVTGVAVGAAIRGMRPIVIHPRMDFFVLGMDPLINQAAKWRYIFNNNAKAPITVRAIINRGGEQGAQHSQALHSWFAHIPGLRVVIPATPEDARDLLIASVLCDDPVLYIDDRWLYDDIDQVEIEVKIAQLETLKPKLRNVGTEITMVAAGWCVRLCCDAAKLLSDQGISADVVDLRQINPIDHSLSIESVKKTGRLLAVDSSWSNCGLSAEIIAGVAQGIGISAFKCEPRRITLPSAPTPAASSLEKNYFPTADMLVAEVLRMVG